MEDDSDSPMAVKVEKHQQCVIFTYFHGDTNSMVDAHFARALSTVCGDKTPTQRAKKIRKTVKTGEGCEGDLGQRRQLNWFWLICFHPVSLSREELFLPGDRHEPLRLTKGSSSRRPAESEPRGRRA